MKNRLTLVAILFATSSFAQYKGEALTGTVMAEIDYSLSIAEKDYRELARVYIVKEVISGVEFETLPTPMSVPVGGQVDFKLRRGGADVTIRISGRHYSRRRNPRTIRRVED